MLVLIKGPGAIFYQWGCTTEFWSDFQEESPKLYVNVSIPVHWLSHLFIEMPQEVHLLHQAVHCAMQIHLAHVCSIYILGERERRAVGSAPRILAPLQVSPAPWQIKTTYPHSLPPCSPSWGPQSHFQQLCVCWFHLHTWGWEDEKEKTIAPQRASVSHSFLLVFKHLLEKIHLIGYIFACSCRY